MSDYAAYNPDAKSGVKDNTAFEYPELPKGYRWVTAWYTLRDGYDSNYVTGKSFRVGVERQVISTKFWSRGQLRWENAVTREAFRYETDQQGTPRRTPMSEETMLRGVKQAAQRCLESVEDHIQHEKSVAAFMAAVNNIAVKEEQA